MGLNWPLLARSAAPRQTASATAFQPSSALQEMGRIIDMHVHYRHHEPDFLDTFLKTVGSIEPGGLHPYTLRASQGGCGRSKGASAADHSFWRDPARCA